MQAVLAIPGSKLLFGGKPLTDHTIPEEFGAFAPTAVLVDLNSALSSKEHFAAVTRELFGPFQVPFFHYAIVYVILTYVVITL